MTYGYGRWKLINSLGKKLIGINGKRNALNNSRSIVKKFGKYIHYIYIYIYIYIYKVWGIIRTYVV